MKSTRKFSYRVLAIAALLGLGAVVGGVIGHEVAK